MDMSGFFSSEKSLTQIVFQYMGTFMDAELSDLLTSCDPYDV